jgi:hypothetical protein
MGKTVQWVLEVEEAKTTPDLQKVKEANSI